MTEGLRPPRKPNNSKISLVVVSYELEKRKRR